jgi:hypothetical protein
MGKIAFSAVPTWSAVTTAVLSCKKSKTSSVSDTPAAWAENSKNFRIFLPFKNSLGFGNELLSKGEGSS